MKKLLALGLCAFVLPAHATSVEVGGAVYELALPDFTPIKVPYATTQAIVAYEAIIDVDGDFGQPLNFDVGGSIMTKWFAGNMAATLSVTCLDPSTSSSIFIGEEMDFGIRYENVSYLAKPTVNVIQQTDGKCQQLKVRIDKEGHLSRQFYTQVTDLAFQVKILDAN
ncbi:hypothetical protein ACFOEE_14490 [Pseudoalteromonas fenneropenaei]|uniref:Uncharacterized protein n=1 Tax=Pseudoalteromonas fenneropenaei TaxID=1737459 RepID=A0ABV7CM46_9GAMM